jgi:GntP family gluconate:H+ symporter
MKTAPLIEIPGLSPQANLLVLAAVAVIGLVILVARFKVHAFLALILASLFVGLSSGTAPSAITRAFQPR